MKRFPCLRKHLLITLEKNIVLFSLDIWNPMNVSYVHIDLKLMKNIGFYYPMNLEEKGEIFKMLMCWFI